jgi:hypothetical protein
LYYLSKAVKVKAGRKQLKVFVGRCSISSTLTLSKQLRDRKVEAEVEVKGKERAGGGLRSLALVLDQSNRQNLLLNHTNHLLLLLPLLLLRLKLDKRVGSLRGGKCCKYGFGWVISCHILS